MNCWIAGTWEIMLSFLAVMATVKGRRQMAVNASVGGSNRGGSWAAINLSLTGGP